MDESPPSQVAVSRLLAAVFFFSFFFPSSNRRVAQHVRTQSHTPYIFFIEAVGRLRDCEEGADGS